MRDAYPQAHNLSAFQDECLQLITSMTEVSRAASYLVDNRSNTVCFKIHHVQPLMHRDYIEHFHQYDPLHPQHCDVQDEAIIRMNDTISIAERLSHPYYQEFLKPWGIRDTVELFLHGEERVVAGFSLFIDRDSTEPGRQEMNKLSSLQRFMQFSLEKILESPEQENFNKFCEHFSLTAKERMVVEQIADGQPNKTIAKNLCCSLATVKTHLQHIFSKLDVRSKAEIASLLYQIGARR